MSSSILLLLYVNLFFAIGIALYICICQFLICTLEIPILIYHYRYLSYSNQIILSDPFVSINLISDQAIPLIHFPFKINTIASLFLILSLILMFEILHQLL